MSDLEDRIRAALHDPPRQIPAWPDPMPRIRRAARRQRLKLVFTSAIVAVAVVTAVVAIVQNLPVAGSSPSGPGGTISPKVTRSASPKPGRSTASGVKRLPQVGAPGFPAAIYPAAVRPRHRRGALAACPAPVALVKPPSSARATAIAIIDHWGTANRAALLHAADRAIWPEIVMNFPANRAHRRRHQAQPILYAGPLKGEHRYFGGGSPGAPDPSSFIRFSCGAAIEAAIVNRSYLVVTGTQSEPALQEDYVFLDRAGHLLLYFTYP
jgi:hypothetical protein